MYYYYIIVDDCKTNDKIFLSFDNDGIIQL